MMYGQSWYIRGGRVRSRVKPAASRDELAEELLNIFVALQTLGTLLGRTLLGPVILVKKLQPLVIRHVLEIGVGKQFLVFCLKLRRTIDNPTPFKVQGRIQGGVVLDQMGDHFVKVGRIHPLVEEAVFVAGRNAGQRLFKNRRVSRLTEPHRGDGFLAFFAASGRNADSGHVLDSVHSPVGGVESVERMRDDTQSLRSV